MGCLNHLIAHSATWIFIGIQDTFLFFFIIVRSTSHKEDILEEVQDTYNFASLLICGVLEIGYALFCAWKLWAASKNPTRKLGEVLLKWNIAVLGLVIIFAGVAFWLAWGKNIGYVMYFGLAFFVKLGLSGLGVIEYAMYLLKIRRLEIDHGVNIDSDKIDWIHIGSHSLFMLGLLDSFTWIVLFFSFTLKATPHVMEAAAYNFGYWYLLFNGGFKITSAYILRAYGHATIRGGKLVSYIIVAIFELFAMALTWFNLYYLNGNYGYVLAAPRIIAEFIPAALIFMIGLATFKIHNEGRALKRLGIMSVWMGVLYSLDFLLTVVYSGKDAFSYCEYLIFAEHKFVFWYLLLRVPLTFLSGFLSFRNPRQLPWKLTLIISQVSNFALSVANYIVDEPFFSNTDSGVIMASVVVTVGFTLGSLIVTIHHYMHKEMHDNGERRMSRDQKITMYISSTGILLCVLGGSDIAYLLAKVFWQYWAFLSDFSWCFWLLVGPLKCLAGLQCIFLGSQSSKLMSKINLYLTSPVEVGVCFLTLAYFITQYKMLKDSDNVNSFTVGPYVYKLLAEFIIAIWTILLLIIARCLIKGMYMLQYIYIYIYQERMKRGKKQQKN